MRVLALLLCIFCAAASAEDIFIVKDGKASSVIVLPEKAGLTEEFAAEQLSYWVREITGTPLEIVRKPSPDRTGIHIGRAFAEGKFAGDLRFLEDSEGFAVRSD